MEETDLQALERFVAENDDLLTLEEQIGRFNIFDSLNIARAEIRHSNFLAWLLTPLESHGQGDLFLKAFLMDLLRHARSQDIIPPLSAIDLDGAELQGVEIRREWKNIDLLIKCDKPKFVIAIENKIDSGEHSNQLQRYEKTITEQFADVPSLHVFLTPDGDDGSEDWVTYSYVDLHRTLTRVRRVNSGAIGGDVAVFLEHYLSLIGNRFMENPELDKLCRQIYTNHRQALDLIFERVAPQVSGLVSRFQEWLIERPNEWILVSAKKTQREILFIPASWKRMLPPIGKSKFDPHWWLTIRMIVGRTRLRFFVVVQPTTNSEFRKRLLQRLLRTKEEFGFSTFFKKKEKLSASWTRIMSEEICSLPGEEEEQDFESIIAKIEKRLAEFQRQTAGLQTAIDELKIENSQPN